MNQQAQIDALEHLVIALLKSQTLGMEAYKAFDKAQATLFSEDGPPGTTQKTEAAEYLAHLKLKLK